MFLLPGVVLEEVEYPVGLDEMTTVVVGEKDIEDEINVVVDGTVGVITVVFEDVETMEVVLDPLVEV